MLNNNKPVFKAQDLLEIENKIKFYEMALAAKESYPLLKMIEIYATCCPYEEFWELSRYVLDKYKELLEKSKKDNLFEKSEETEFRNN